MSHIFISYSKKNKSYARRLADYLRDNGFDVWIDDRIDYGDNWLQTMVDAVRQCAAFVVVTPESEASRWVQLEVAWAHRWNKKIFPVLRSGENWPVFELTQYSDCTSDTLPDSRFILELSEYAPSRQVAGRNVTLQPQQERAPRSLDHAEPPVDTSSTADVISEITEFMQLRQDGEWPQARMVLASIARSGTAPAWFDVQHYVQEIEDAIERERETRRRSDREAAAAREYAVLKLMAKQDKPERVWAALQAFWQNYPEYDPDGLADHVRPRPSLPPEVKELLDVIASPQSEPHARAEAGRKLAQLGDPRPGVGLRPDGLPDIDWVDIPAGEFLMGSDKDKNPAAYDDEVPQQAVYLEAFDISRYPITVAQYEAFVNDGGYAVDAYWTDEGLKWRGDKRQPEGYWNVPEWHITNHPIVGVAWYEVYAFTRWLSAKLEMPVALPTEAQWEKAARGTYGRIYPYEGEFDPDKGNTYETGLGRTTAVGIFPAGASPYGVLDMSGNVWEWSLTKWRDSYSEPEDNDPHSDARRVVRGGSWSYDQHLARAAYRLRDDPSARDYNIGFRVVRVPHL